MIRSYNEMPIGVYQKICDIVAEYEPDDAGRNVPIIALLTGRTEDEILTMPLPEFAVLRDECAFLLEEPKENKAKRRYEIRGKKYEVARDERYLTAGQFIDYQAYAKDVNRNVCGLLAALLVPEGHVYGDGYDIFEVQDEIREGLPVTDALALVNFTMRWSRRWSGDTRRSLVSARRMIRKERRISKGLRRIAVRNLTAILRSGGGWQIHKKSLTLPASLGILSWRSR